MKRPILLGRIVGAQGIRGEVKVQTFTGDPEAIGDYGPLSDDTGIRQFVLTVVRSSRAGVVARIVGVADRNGAEALKGVGLHIDRERLPEPVDGEYYHEDLTGLCAVTPDGIRLGKVVSLQNFGGGDLVELSLDGQRGTELVPFTIACVPEIDIAAGRIVVAMPAATDADDREADEQEADDGAGASSEKPSPRG